VSDFPVFTLYVKKQCLAEARTCDRAWNFERVIGHELSGFAKRTETVDTRGDCQKLCLNETTFDCR